MLKSLILFLCIVSSSFALNTELNLKFKQAIVEGDHETVIMLINNPEIDIEEPNILDDTPLRLTIQFNRPKIAELLLQSGANVEDGGNYKTPLKYSIIHEKIEIMKLLFKYGADVNNAEKGFFPLHLAIFSQIPEIVRIVLDQNPDVLNTNGGFSFLHYARTGARFPNWEIAKMVAQATHDALKKKEENEDKPK